MGGDAISVGISQSAGDTDIISIKSLAAYSLQSQHMTVFQYGCYTISRVSTCQSG